MGYKAAVQILKQAEDLKNKVLRKCDLLSDSQAWIDQQKLQKIYHQALVLDLEYALDKKVEQDLWNIGFKNHISILQELTRDKKNTQRSECQTLLTWCLEAASGFYLTLLQELCDAFDLDLPFRRRSNVFGQTNVPLEQNLPQSSSCLYICQYCLVHLGDIARYRNQRKQAENFYKEAILVSPTSGHPYNQLALLEASQGNKLSTVFYYIRAIAVKNPFPASTTNLLSTLNSTVDRESPLESIQTKITVNEFIQIFLCAHALLHTASDLPQVEICIKSLNTSMTALVATQSFTTEKLIKITAINLYALKYIITTNTDLTEDETKVREYILDLLAGSLSAFLVPVHTLKNDESLLDYYALPAVKILMDWIRTEADILKENVFMNRLQIWPSLCKLLNNVSIYLKDLQYDKYCKMSLPEDKTLQGFTPLLKTFKNLDFKNEIEDKKTEKLVRIKRIVEFASFITEFDVNNTKLMNKTVEGDSVTFEPGHVQPDPTNDLLEEMKSFNIIDIPRKTIEKRGGILKPQGSLEKSREERELLSSTEPNLLSDISNTSSSSSGNGKKDVKIKRGKQNVAIQSIFKKLEENKQVKFTVEDIKDHEKQNTFDKAISKTPAPPLTQFPLRTQSFNQNHPAFPVSSTQSDYLSTLRNVSKPHNQQNNYKFPTPELKPTLPPNSGPPGPSMVPYSNLQNQSFFANTNTKSSFNTNPIQNSFNNTSHSHPMPPLYPNIQFPGSHYGAKLDEPPPAANSPWWPNSNQPPPPPPNVQRSDNFHFAPFNTNLPYMQQSQPDYNTPPQNQAGGDMFNSPWGNFRRPNFAGDMPMNYETNSNHSVSMRQAMLKETSNASNRPPSVYDSFSQNQNSPGGYSLFNTNSWTPNLVGQLRNPKPQDNKINNLPQHSLFTGQGPQSLAQLLEQQQLQKTEP